MTRSLSRMLYIQNIQLYAESKSFLERIVFFKPKRDSFKGIQQRLFKVTVHNVLQDINKREYNLSNGGGAVVMKPFP